MRAASLPSAAVGCPPGFGFDPITNTCTECIPGEASPGGQATCQPCPEGEYAAGYGLAICYACECLDEGGQPLGPICRPFKCDPASGCSRVTAPDGTPCGISRECIEGGCTGESWLTVITIVQQVYIRCALSTMACGLARTPLQT